MARDWDVRADELSAEAIADGEPTAWFDRLYAAGDAGEVSHAVGPRRPAGAAA